MIAYRISVSGVPRAAQRTEQAARRVRRALVTGVRRGAVITETEAKRLLTAVKGHDPFWGATGAAAPGLGVRTGATRRSVTQRVYAFERGPTAAVAVVGSDAPAILAHEEGATIRPVSAKMLRIPTAKAKTPSGVDRFMGQSAKGIAGTFIFPNRRQRASGKVRAKRLWIARTVGKRGKLELLYMLVAQVVLKPRHTMANARDRAEPKVRAEVEQAVAQALVG